MNLLKLETYGFKSFADKTEISFGDGITAIVGPNGCGKSNVSDVIRWILGEQSARQLRGKSMTDLIFGGTEQRKSMSYCEGSLYFDNTNRLFPLDFDEVVISRKLYRSGESEYSINKRVVRLRDIQDLMRDVGLGRDGYSVVGQGRMDAILNARPEDRRAIFEESLGISKFSVHKNDTERKLERTADNMARVRDIMTVLERRLPTLERQSSDAEEYQRLKSDLRRHEINRFICAAKSSEGEKEAHTAKAAEFGRLLSEKENEITLLRQRYDDIFAGMNSVDDEITALAAEETRLRVILERKAGENNLFAEKLRGGREMAVSLRADIERMESENEQAKGVYSSAERRKGIGQAQAKEASDERDELICCLSEINEEIDACRERIRQQSEGVLELLDGVAEIKSKKASVLSEKNAIIERLSEINKEKSVNSQRMSGLSAAQKGMLTEFGEAKAKLSEASEALKKATAGADEARAVLAKLTPRLNSLNEERLRLKTNFDMLKGISERYEGYNQTVKLLMKDREENEKLSDCILGVVANLIRVPEKFELAMETALGGALQNIVTETDTDAAFVIDYLKKKRYGRLTFLPLGSIKPHSFPQRKALSEKGALGVASEVIGYDAKFSPVILNLLGSTLVADNMDNAVVIARKYGYGFRIVTLDGEILSPQGSLTGGSHRSKEYNILATDRLIEDTQNKLRNVSAELSKIRSEYEKAQENHGRLSREKEKTAMECADLSVKTAALEQKLGGSAALSDSEKDISVRLTAEKKQKQERLSEIDKLIAEFEEEEALRSSAKNERAETSGEEERKLASLNAEKDRLTESFAAAKERYAKAVASVESAEAEIVASRERAERNSALLTSRKEEYEAKLREIEECEAEVRRRSGDTPEAEILKKTESEKAAKQKEKAGFSEKLSETDELKRRKDEEANDLRRKIDKENMLAEKVETELEAMQEKIYEDYGLTYESALLFGEEDYDFSSSAKEISRIKNAIVKLGDVNVSAIEEYKSVKAEYDADCAQMEDLEKALADLNKIISDLTREMVTRFDAGFEKISSNFSRIFSELFSGGKASMRIEREEGADPLDFGIEIEAQPPGKKLQNISLLSGGERALTCIAILFAILRLSPMPFCVLDEIEAPLDDANAERVARYLRRYSGETQFVVITHKKPTMENADRLFGVTMQEKGISKIVSVLLTEAVRHVE